QMVEDIMADMPDYSNQLIPEKTPEELKREEAAASVPTKAVDIGSLNTEFDAESAEIIKGKATQ
ncbi:MAG: hypothetical protein IIU30_04775, partial [Treponema sp.]|nr:hypothetical protein [Treponema sp.]